MVADLNAELTKPFNPSTDSIPGTVDTLGMKTLHRHPSAVTIVARILGRETESPTDPRVDAVKSHP